MSELVDWRRPRADRDSAHWWEALARHTLLLQRCDACAGLRWPPRALCPHCGTFDWTWVPSAGRGTVASWIRSHRAFLPGLDPPYLVLLVRLDDQPDLLLPGGWAGPADREPSLGLAVEVAFADVAEDLSLLHWRPADRPPEEGEPSDGR